MADPHLVPGTSTRPPVSVVIASDAGLGSEVLLAVQLRRNLPAHMTVSHSPVDAVPAGADVLLAHAALAERARRCSPHLPVVSYELSVGDPAVSAFIDAVRRGQPAGAAG